jgi:hypothetical protein
VLDDARAELFVQPEVGALSEQMQIKIGKDRWIAVWILNLIGLLRAAVQAGQGDGKPVGKELGLILDDGLEEAIPVNTVHRTRLVTAHNRDCESLRLERADDIRRLAIHSVLMNAQDVERRAVVAADNRRYGARVSGTGI